MPATLTARPSRRLRLYQPSPRQEALNVFTDRWNDLVRAIRHEDYPLSARPAMLAAARALNIALGQIARTVQ
jgi:hypothetical protein